MEQRGLTCRGLVLHPALPACIAWQGKAQCTADAGGAPAWRVCLPPAPDS